MASSSGWFGKKSGKKGAGTAGGHHGTGAETPLKNAPGSIVMTKVTHAGTDTGAGELSAQAVVSAVAMAIACLSADASAQEHGLRRLVNLSRNVDEKALLAEAIPLVVPLLSSSFPVIQMFATFALVYLAEDRANQAAIRDLRAIPLLVPLLNSNNTEIVEKVIWLFTILSHDSQSRAIMVQEGTIQRVCTLLATPTRWDQLINGFCVLLRNLFFEVEHQDVFLSCQGVQTLINLPVLTSDVPQLQLQWTMLLSILTYFRSPIRACVLDSGAAPTLVTLLSTSDDNTVRNYATQSLTNLSFDIENVEGIMNSGAGRPLFNIFRSAAPPKTIDSVLFEHILTALTNLAMTDDDIIALFVEEEQSLQQLLDICEPKSPFTTQIRLRATNFLVTIARFERGRRVLLELGALPSMQASFDPPPFDVPASSSIGGSHGEALGTSGGMAASSGATSGADGLFEAESPLVVHQQLVLARSMAVHNLNMPFSAEFKKSIASSAERPDPKPSTQRDPHEQHRMRVMNEILETEKNYVANLLVVCKVYEEQLAAMPPKNKMVSVDERKTMFKMFDFLYRVHQEFLQALQKSVIDHHKDPTSKMGPVFLGLADCLKSYRVFMNNYENASNTLAAALKRPAFAAWAEEQEGKFKTKSLPNLLIEPIQRIPRYLLLLGEILKKMDSSHIDFADFQNAHEQILEAANFLEAEKEKAINKSKLIELQGQIKGLPSDFDLTDVSSRRFIHSGQLLLETGKAKMSEYRHFFLLNDIVIIAHEKKNLIHFNQILDVKNLIVSNIQNEQDEGDERNAFQVLTEKTNLVVSTTKASEKAEWLNAFRQAITESQAK